MNKKKYFTIVLCVMGICLAILSGVIVATKFIGPSAVDSGIVMDQPPKKDRVNILVLGVDGGESRSDTIMLVSLDNKNKKVSVLSIPRDTRVLDGKAYDKITHLYSGPKKEQATIDAVKRITGVPIHYYVIVDFMGFRNIMDILGGIQIDVPNVPNNFSNGRHGMYYSDPGQKLDIQLKEGPQMLNGKQAEGFVRFRYGYIEGDLGRIKAQQYFLQELTNQKLTPEYILKAPQLYKEVAKNLKTNYTLSDMTSHLITLKTLKPENFETFQLPGYSAPANTRYGTLSCFIYNQAETDALMKEHFITSPPVDSTTSKK